MRFLSDTSPNRLALRQTAKQLPCLKAQARLAHAKENAVLTHTEGSGPGAIRTFPKLPNPAKKLLDKRNRLR